MALDRQSIEKRDFPIGRRGYEPDAVDEHLAMLADEVDALRRSATRSTRTESLASAASEQVRLIVEAAEQSAVDIVREAELEAQQIRQAAHEAAQAARTGAGDRAREHVERVATSTATLLERSEALEDELRTRLENVRGSATRLSQELRDLQATVGQLRGDTTAAAGVVEPAFEDPSVLPASPHIPAYGDREGMLPGEPDLVADDAPEDSVGDDPVAESTVSFEPEFEEEPVPAGVAGGGGDEEGARLIALNMALNGTPRDDTERYLIDNFELADPEALLDDVYARAGQ